MNTENVSELASVYFIKNLDRRLQVLKTRETNPQRQTESGDYSDYKEPGLLMLTNDRQWAWKRILSSLATGEGQEFQVIGPLTTAFQHDPKVTQWFAIHSNDEKNHCDMLRKYLKDIFAFEKKKPTLTDRIVYEGLGPFIQNTITKKPALGLALINAYELSVVGWLQELVKTAKKDGLFTLSNMIDTIIEDELSHIAAIGHLVQSLQKSGSFSSKWDQLQIQGFVQILRFDMMQGPLAIHNREMTKAFHIMGIDPEVMNKVTKVAAKRTVGLLQGKA